MGNTGKYADVILPLALRDTYTYCIPEELCGKLSPGQRITVQFGSKRIYSAIVWNIHENAPDTEDIKPILGILDPKPLINTALLRFWEWLAEYYLCTPGEVMKAALPSGLKLESETRIRISEGWEAEDVLDDLEETALKFIRNNPGTSLEDLGKLLKRKNALPLVKKLIEKKAVKLEEKVTSGYKPKTQIIISINPDFADENKLNEAIESLGKAPVQEKCILKFLEMTSVGELKRDYIPMAELTGAEGCSQAALNGLIRKKILLRKTHIVSRIDQEINVTEEIKALTEVQQEALEKILGHWKEDKVSLLHGVTSSGKTEIYIHLIKKAIEEGKQVLYLLPEIALTTQIINRLRAVFGEKVLVFHSRFSDAERVEVWEKASDPESGSPLILGARSSVFMPFFNLGLIIVDEEHENSYKQLDPAPRYHARDAAIVLGKIHNANVILGSATPSLESYYNARTGKYGLAEIWERYSKILLPDIQLSNTREAYRRKKMKGHFTPELLTAIDDALVNKEQIILFQNRRGYSPYMQCDNCGHIPKCRDCDVSLTVHKKQMRLVCHYCGYSEKLTPQCKECGSTGILAKGLGTEKIEDEIQIIFPDARVARLDLDAARSKSGYSRIISDFEHGKTDILIGTQMISKGLDFDNVRLVGVVNADNLLHFPDFRSFERSFQLITQVSGRAGRKKKRGLVIIQTGDPEHRVLQQVLNNDYNSLYKWEMSERQAFKYPPFTRLVKLTFKHKNMDLLNRGAHVFARELRKKWPLQVLGPQSPPVSRISGYYIRTVLIKAGKGKEQQQIREEIHDLRTRMKNDKTFRSVIVQPDVDPV